MTSQVLICEMGHKPSNYFGLIYIGLIIGANSRGEYS